MSIRQTAKKVSIGCGSIRRIYQEIEDLLKKAKNRRLAEANKSTNKVLVRQFKKYELRNTSEGSKYFKLYYNLDVVPQTVRNMP